MHNILTLGNIDEEVDYEQALSSGHTTAAAVTAMAGAVIGNGAPVTPAARWPAEAAGQKSAHGLG